MTYPDRAPGPYTFEVRGLDRADKVDPTPARAAWSVAATDPDTRID